MRCLSIRPASLRHWLCYNHVRFFFYLIVEFFRKNGVCVMTMRELFDFVTDPNITEENIETYLEKVRGTTRRKSSKICPTNSWLNFFYIRIKLFKNLSISRLNKWLHLERIWRQRQRIKSKKRCDRQSKIYSKCYKKPRFTKEYHNLAYTSKVNSVFCAIWLVPLPRNILNYSPPSKTRWRPNLFKLRKSFFK